MHVCWPTPLSEPIATFIAHGLSFMRQQSYILSIIVYKNFVSHDQPLMASYRIISLFVIPSQIILCMHNYYPQYVRSPPYIPWWSPPSLVCVLACSLPCPAVHHTWPPVHPEDQESSPELYQSLVALSRLHQPAPCAAWQLHGEHRNASSGTESCLDNNNKKNNNKKLKRRGKKDITMWSYLLQSWCHCDTLLRQMWGVRGGQPQS